VNLKVEDYYPSGERFLLRFKEKGGKEKELPVQLEELLDEYLKATGLSAEPSSPLFPAALGKTGKLSCRPLVRTDVADMLKRRLKQAGLPAHYSPHSFRATGITPRVFRLERGRNRDSRLDYETSFVQPRRCRPASQPVHPKSGHQDLRGNDRV
jgi:integrase